MKKLNLVGIVVASGCVGAGGLSFGGPTSRGNATPAEQSAGAPTKSSQPAAGGGSSKLSVLDVKIGMSIDSAPGYTCTKDKLTPSGERQDRHCVKFTDARCSGRPTGIGFKRYSDKVPMGCFLDYSSEATYLDGTLMQDPHTGDTEQVRNGRKPLASVHIIGTESTPSKVYRIWYMFAEDDLLAESSKLHKALVAKYGEPREIHSGKMKWKVDTTEMYAQCIEHQNCEIVVEDRKFEENVEDAQKEADAQQKRSAAPAPQL